MDCFFAMPLIDMHTLYVHNDDSIDWGLLQGSKIYYELCHLSVRHLSDTSATRSPPVARLHANILLAVLKERL